MKLFSKIVTIPQLTQTRGELTDNVFKGLNLVKSNKIFTGSVEMLGSGDLINYFSKIIKKKILHLSPLD